MQSTPSPSLLSKLRKTLQEPYPIDKSVSSRLAELILLPAAIFCILYFIAPFGLDTAPAELRLWLAFTFALCTFFPMLISLFFIVPLIDESRWTAGKEILNSALSFVVIAGVNLGYTVWLGYADLTLRNFFLSLFSTVAVGFGPVALWVMWNQHRLMVRYRQEAQAVNARMNGPEEQAPQRETRLVKLEADNPAHSLQLEAESLLLVASADNYVEVMHGPTGQLKRELLRTTLTRVEANLAAHAGFLRVHRQFVVNLNRVVRVSGNAQGLRLHFEGTEFTVPVSRRLNDRMLALR